MSARRLMYFRILTPVGNDRGPAFTEAMLKTLHAADHDRHSVTFRIDSHKGVTSLGIEVPPELKSVVLHELQDSYPGLEVTKAPSPANTAHEWTTELRKHPDVFSLRSFETFTDETHRSEFADPLSGVLTSLQSGRSGRLSFSMELNVSPATRKHLRSANRIRKTLNGRFRSEIAKAIYLRLATSHSWLSRILAGMIAPMILRKSEDARNVPETNRDEVFECRLVLRAVATENAAQIATKRLAEIGGALARFNADAKLVCRRHRYRRGFLLSTSELAALWHPPTASVDSVARVQRPTFRELEPPTALASTKRDLQSTVLGRVCFRAQRDLASCTMDDLRRHLIAIGRTGCGKSTFLLNMVIQQMQSGRSCVLVDPHGQLAEEVLDFVPRKRTNDVIYFNAADRVAPVGFNPMLGPPGTPSELIADGVLTAFKNVFGLEAGSAPRLLHIFRNCLLSLVGTPHASLANVQHLLIDAPFRKSVIAAVTNEAVRNFWLSEFNRWNDRDRTQYLASLQNKLGAFLVNEQLGRIFDADRKGIQLRQIMDNSKILICNLSKGTCGHDASTLLGSLLLSSLHVAAMSRANIPESERADCVVVVDEFHSYLADGNTTMADALAESRKYRTSYALSTQMLAGQLDPATLAGVLGNCGSTLCMTVGPRDAQTLAELLGHGLAPNDLMQIPKYHAYLRLLIHGAPHTFSVTTLPSPTNSPRQAKTVRRASQQEYGNQTL